MSEANQVRIAYRAAGSTDDWKILRRTGDSLTAGAETTRSDEIRSDRKRGDQKITTITVGGGVDFEFSAETFDDMLSAAMCSSWETDTPDAGTDQLTVGTDTTKFDILKSFLDIDEHVLFTDMEVSELQLTLDSGSRVTGSITFAGEEAETDYDPSGDTFDDETTTVLMDSSNNLGSILIDDSSVDGMCITGMSLTINNNHQAGQCVGTQYQYHTKGSSDITGSKTMRMSSDAFALWENTLLNTPISSEFTLDDGTTEYRFAVGKEYLSGDLPSGGLDELLTLELSTSVATDADGETLIIERT